MTRRPFNSLSASAAKAVSPGGCHRPLSGIVEGRSTGSYNDGTTRRRAFQALPGATFHREESIMLGFTLSLALVGNGASVAPASADTPSASQMRVTIERGLGFLEKQGVAWLDQRKCIACHHGAWMIWGL